MKKESPNVLPLDAGNNLFAEFYASDDPLRSRADLIVEAMAKMGVKAMGVGMRDLSAGPEFIQGLATRYGVKPVSANLARDGKLIFAPSVILTVGGIKVGVIGASPPNPFKFPGVVGLPLSETVVPEAKKLRSKVDVVVVLAAVTYPDAMQIAKEAGSAVDFVFQNHEARGVGPGIPIAVNDNFLIHTGERGRQLARLEANLSGSGKFIDASEAERERQSLASLDDRIKSVEQKIATATDPKLKKGYEDTLESFMKRRAELAAAVHAQEGKTRTVRLSFPTLGPDVASDPVLAQQVAKHNPVNNH